jgi:hypothetical protein
MSATERRRQAVLAVPWHALGLLFPVGIVRGARVGLNQPGPLFNWAGLNLLFISFPFIPTLLSL